MTSPREGSRDTSDGILVCTMPDWCFLPGGGGPVPFQIYALQSDDANTTATVKQTSLRSHTRASYITTCYGDEGGTGLGVKSGTVKGVCQPKTWSSTVFFEGHNAVRHDDLWWMNNENTVGKLIYLKDISSYDATPQSEAPPQPSNPPQTPDLRIVNAIDDGSIKPNFQLAQEVLIPRLAPFEGLERLAPFGERFAPMERLTPELKPEMAPRPVPQPLRPPMPGPMPNPDSNRTSGKCRTLILCFDAKNLNVSEFQDQLKMQMNVLRTKLPLKCKKDIDDYKNRKFNGTELDYDRRAEKARARARKQYIQANKQSWIAANPGQSWDDHLRTLNALHRLDMVAGGDPSDIARMGGSAENQEIGRQWVQGQGMFGLFQSRRDELSDYAAEMAEKYCPCDVIVSTCSYRPVPSYQEA